MNLRRAHADDAPRLAALAQWVWLDSYAQSGVHAGVLPYLAASFSEGAFRHLLADPDRALWVHEHEGHLQALAQLRRGATAPVAARATVELERLYVAPPCTGQGQGVHLLKAARATWPTEGLWLTVWVGNTGAQRFYAREGGVVKGETDFFLDGQPHRNFVYAWECA